MAIRNAARVAALLVLAPALFAPAAAAQQPSSRTAEAAASGGAAQPDVRRPVQQDARRVAQHTPNPLEKLDNPTCLKPGEETPEIYGPTDVGATAGNGSLSAAVNPQGTLSVLRWPSPSYYDQLNYKTIDRDLPRRGLEPNEGAFSGLVLRLRNGERQLRWLRELDVEQRYAAPDSDTIRTSFRSDRYGVTVEIADAVPPDSDVLMRRHELRLDGDSPVASARLIAFANLNPTASKLPYLPTKDWCHEEDGSDVAAYDADSDAIVYGITERGHAAGERSSVAIAMGASRPSTGHQVGTDPYSNHPSGHIGPRSAYDDAEDGRLSGNDRAGPAEADSALAIPIGERDPVTVSFAAADSRESAVSLLDRHRDRDVRAQARAKRQDELRWLRDAPLPRDAPEPVVRLAKRALVSLHQAIDTSAAPNGEGAAVVASISTQPPYGEDWIRDGAFFNEVLDMIGHGDLVERHNQFYAAVQKKLAEGAPPGSPLSVCEGPTPSGNWFMANYADGGDAGPITWEIDETALGLWTLWRHHERGEASSGYLERIYPAIRRSAEFLVAFRDPVTKLPPGTACEDDTFPPPGKPTMHSAGPVLLAMRSAVEAAEALGRTDDAERYRKRVAELETAIDRTYAAGGDGSGGSGGAWTADYGRGGWALWPVRVKGDYDHPRMRAQAQAVWESVEPSFRAPDGPRERGQYEAKALLGLAHAYQALGDDAGLERVRRGLRWIADVQAGYQDTGILGESWYVRDGRVASVVAQPHVWAQVLFYLAALEAYGSAPYQPGEPGHLVTPTRQDQSGERASAANAGGAADATTTERSSR